jgi:hypothetical protein
VRGKRTVGYTRDEVPEGRTDWARVDALTDEEIDEAIRTDPDAAPTLDEDWFRNAEPVAPEGKRPLTWGDTVRVSAAAPPRFQPGELGAVCGLRTVETRHAADEFAQPVGTTLYLVEFAKAEAIEVPEPFLNRANSS